MTERRVLPATLWPVRHGRGPASRRAQLVALEQQVPVLVVGRAHVPESADPFDQDTVLCKARYDAFYGTPLDDILRSWGVDTLVICGTGANIGVHYTAASAGLRWYAVVIARDAISALEPFDLEASLRQITFVSPGR